MGGAHLSQGRTTPTTIITASSGTSGFVDASGTACTLTREWELPSGFQAIVLSNAELATYLVQERRVVPNGVELEWG